MCIRDRHINCIEKLIIMIQYKAGNPKLKYPSYSTFAVIIGISSNLARRNCLPTAQNLMHRVYHTKKLPPIDRGNLVNNKELVKPLKTLSRPLKRAVDRVGYHKTAGDGFNLELPDSDNYEGMLELMQDIKEILNQSTESEVQKLDTTATETPDKPQVIRTKLRKPSMILRKTKVRAPVKKAASEKLGTSFPQHRPSTKPPQRFPRPRLFAKRLLERCDLSLIHICRCRRYAVCRSRWSPYH
eukprot:TRINITY_DN17455_c0_g2_i1.p1 TRINITY_DN17455_c0_g2~~TRINITY_DN17455_c0_g2_i1.p1  ORF type:complete len:242 (-),score=30.30 TRINITY_DN17455_c0_g2_i1:15-740(-)